jgi:hypothetical protein
MKVRMKDCKNCGKQYGATNGNQSYCCDVCRQQAYYKRHGIDRSQRPIYGTNVNHQFTPIIDSTPKNDVNAPTKEIEQIAPAPVTQVAPLITTSYKNINADNFGAILEQMNKTHQAQMEAMETRLKLSFEQERHEREKQAKDEVISRLQNELKSQKDKSTIDTNQVLGGLTAMFSGVDVSELLKGQA